jgi:hypothetical protein
MDINEVGFRHVKEGLFDVCSSSFIFCARTVTAMATTNGTNGNMPQKTREESNHHMESSIWNDVKFRPDDIIITTYAKSGTTVSCRSIAPSQYLIIAIVGSANRLSAHPPRRPNRSSRRSLTMGRPAHRPQGGHARTNRITNSPSLPQDTSPA